MAVICPNKCVLMCNEGLLPSVVSWLKVYSVTFKIFNNPVQTGLLVKHLDGSPENNAVWSLIQRMK